jgi:hypothetical protein
MTFKPGQSGNPAGKPPGTRNRVTRAVEELLDGEAEALTRKAVEMAKAGDIQAMRICLDRIAPARKDRYVPIDLPPLDSADDAVKASAVIVAALSAGNRRYWPAVKQWFDQHHLGVGYKQFLSLTFNRPGHSCTVAFPRFLIGRRKPLARDRGPRRLLAV